MNIKMDNNHVIKKAARVYRAVIHPLRRQILSLLDEKEYTVTELYVALRIEQSVCSQQLSILREARLVKTRREGKRIYYISDKRGMEELLLASERLLQPRP